MVHICASPDHTLQIKPLHFSLNSTPVSGGERQEAALGVCALRPSSVFCAKSAKPLLVFPSRTHIFQGSDYMEADINPVKSQIGAETNVGGCYLRRLPDKLWGHCQIPSVDSRKACAPETQRSLGLSKYKVSHGFQILRGRM